MKVLLMHRDRDFDFALPQRARHERNFDPLRTFAPHERALMQDLELDTLLRAMANGDELVLAVARQAILSGLQSDVETILYRQAIVKDCLKNPAVVRALYALAVEAIERRRKHFFGVFMSYPSGILHSAIDLLQLFVGMLRRLRAIADAHAGRFESEGFTALLAMLQREFSDQYFDRVEDHLKELKFKHGALVSAELGKRNEGANYVLRLPPDRRPNWLRRLLGEAPRVYTFHLHPRDEAGARALSDLRGRGINLVANALAQSAEHILSFFDLLQTELAFYVGCLNLHDSLAARGAPMSFPRLDAAGTRRHRCSGLYDVCLALTMQRSVVGNAANADGKSLVIITGANTGGKSTFMRGIGLAQIMMQCGLFVGAEDFRAELCSALFTHYKREEDATMKSGKLDEELARMSAIVDHIVPHSLLLFNESFGATNEREGSEIARQVVRALLEKRAKVFFVTHLYEFAHSFFDRNMKDALFLRAERLPDGTRTFRLVEGEPLETSFGEDLYREIFAPATAELRASEPGKRSA